MSERLRRKIGILGGSFDPPHWGHFLSARAVAEKLQLERVLVIPANIQPHKLEGSVAPAELRLKMASAACRLDPLFRVSDIEIARGGVSYTVDTLRQLVVKYPLDKYSLFLILGADAAAELPRWREPEVILKLATLAVMDRAEAALSQLPEEWLLRIIRTPTPNIEISSTEIRRRVAAGLPVSWFVPPAVEKTIRRYSLYSISAE